MDLVMKMENREHVLNRNTLKEFDLFGNLFVVDTEKLRALCDAALNCAKVLKREAYMPSAGRRSALEQIQKYADAIGAEIQQRVSEVIGEQEPPMGFRQPWSMPTHREIQQTIKDMETEQERKFE